MLPLNHIRTMHWCRPVLVEQYILFVVHFHWGLSLVTAILILYEGKSSTFDNTKINYLKWVSQLSNAIKVKCLCY